MCQFIQKHLPYFMAVNSFVVGLSNFSSVLVPPVYTISRWFLVDIELCCEYVAYIVLICGILFCVQTKLVIVLYGENEERKRCYFSMYTIHIPPCILSQNILYGEFTSTCKIYIRKHFVGISKSVIEEIFSLIWNNNLTLFCVFAMNCYQGASLMGFKKYKFNNCWA